MATRKAGRRSHSPSGRDTAAKKVTSKRRAPPKASRLTDGRFRLAFEKAPIGIAIVGLDRRLRRVNRSLCEALGYSEAELLARAVVDITHPDDVRRDKALADKLFGGEIPIYRLDKRFITKDGRLVWLDLTAFLIRGDRNEPLYGMAMVENITERKRAEEALRTSEERYRSFVVNSSEGIWRFEVEQPIDTRLPADEQIKLFFEHSYIAECNDAMARIHGYDRAEDVVGARFSDLKLVSGPAGIDTLRDFISNGYRLRDVESIRIDPDGRKWCFANNMIGIVVNGYLLRVWGTRRDETERKLAEEELLHSRQQLRSLAAHLQTVRERERAETAREMHDVLGQWLTALKIDLAWLSKKLPQAANDSVRAGMADRIKDGNLLLDQTIAAVKTLSAELRPGVLDKFGLSAAVEWLCREFERRTGIKCESQVPNKDVRLSTERATAIFRIIQESLTNVASYSQASKVVIKLKVNKGDATLSVRDNGRGITRAEIMAPGSLGLLGMRERAEILGGDFAVDGKAGGGTTIKARIPIGEQEPPGK